MPVFDTKKAEPEKKDTEGNGTGSAEAAVRGPETLLEQAQRMMREAQSLMNRSREKEERAAENQKNIEQVAIIETEEEKKRREEKEKKKAEHHARYMRYYRNIRRLKLTFELWSQKYPKPYLGQLEPWNVSVSSCSDR